MYRIIFGVIISVCFFSCGRQRLVDVVVSIQGAAGKKVYLVKIPYLDEKEVILDSATVIDLDHPLHFSIDDEEERLFLIKVPGSANRYQFINDSRHLKLTINHLIGKYNIEGSPASISLKNFNDHQVQLADSLRKLVEQIKAAGTAGDPAGMEVYEHAYKKFIHNYIAYGDTVKSPAAFMAVVSLADFETEYTSQRTFITEAAKRFQGYQPIQQVKAEMLNMIKIYEEELQLGDKIPPVILPSGNDKSFSTASLSGSYFLLDIWSTWCPQCRVDNYYKRKLNAKFSGKNFSMVSIAFDDEPEIWKRTVAKDSLTWMQLIDQKMWRGVSANTLKFDSIPFNFLVDPQGNIIAKAIKADSLLAVVGRYVK